MISPSEETTETLIARASAATEQGHADEAIELYRQALDTDPEHDLARNNLACLLIDGGRFDEACDLFAGPDPDQRELRHTLGFALLEQGDLGRAEAIFRSIIELDPEDSTARNHLAMVLLRREELEAALGELLRVVRERPAMVEAWNNLGVVYWHRNDLGLAQESFESALRVDPYNVDAHNNLGCVLRAAGELEEAIEAFKLAVQLEPKDPAIQLNLAVAYRQSGDGRRARSHLHRHLDLQHGESTPDVRRLVAELEEL
ncbi:MAG: tetratricopeptide repeat protein [Planctomycetota bacterium]